MLLNTHQVKGTDPIPRIVGSFCRNGILLSLVKMMEGKLTILCSCHKRIRLTRTGEMYYNITDRIGMFGHNLTL